MAVPLPTKPEIAARHEALYPRLATLTRQAEAAAAKRPDAPVGESTRRLAEDLLFEARQFTRRPKSIPPVAPDQAGLATQLGQAMAALDSFETAHTLWDDTLKCFVWWVRSAVPLPVARLKPKVAKRQTPAQSARMADLRQKLVRRLDGHKQQQYDLAYAEGFRAGQSLPLEPAEPSPPMPAATPATSSLPQPAPLQTYDAVALSELNPRLHFRP